MLQLLLEICIFSLTERTVPKGASVDPLEFCSTTNHCNSSQFKLSNFAEPTLPILSIVALLIPEITATDGKSALYVVKFQPLCEADKAALTATVIVLEITPDLALKYKY